MKISTILDHIESGHMALPEFQRGYAWNGEQVRKLFRALYLRRPIGGLLVWATESSTANHRGDGALSPGVGKLLLNGQQELSQPVALLLNESSEALALASTAGFRCFNSAGDFKWYVEAEILAGQVP